jgi:hypothetical protein
MKRVIAWSLAIVVLVQIGTSPASATEPFAKVGTYGAAWLQFPVGIRNIGMGATGTSDISGFATGYFNPASMAWADVTTITGSHESFDPAGLGMRLSEIRLSSPFPIRADSADADWRFAGSLAYTRQGMDPQVERTIFIPEGTGRTIDLDNWMVSALVASQWNHGVTSIGGGASVKYLSESFASSDHTTWAFDLGMVAAFSFPVHGGMVRPRLGYAALNLDNGGTHDGREYVIATEQRGGLGLDLAAPRVMLFDRPVPSVSLAVNYDLIDQESGRFTPAPDFASGVEVSFANLVHVRYGVLDDQYTMYGAGLGWDDGRVLFRVDYAHSRPEDSFYREFFNLERDTFGAIVGVRW